MQLISTLNPITNPTSSNAHHPSELLKTFPLNKSTKHSHMHCTKKLEMLPRDAFWEPKVYQNTFVIVPDMQCSPDHLSRFGEMSRKKSKKKKRKWDNKKRGKGRKGREKALGREKSNPPPSKKVCLRPCRTVRRTDCGWVGADGLCSGQCGISRQRCVVQAWSTDGPQSTASQPAGEYARTPRDDAALHTPPAKQNNLLLVPPVKATTIANKPWLSGCRPTDLKPPAGRCNVCRVVMQLPSTTKNVSLQLCTNIFKIDFYHGLAESRLS